MEAVQSSGVQYWRDIRARQNVVTAISITDQEGTMSLSMPHELCGISNLNRALEVAEQSNFHLSRSYLSSILLLL
jgi:hypothetical protein